PNNKSATKIALLSGNAAIDAGKGGGDVALKKDQLLSVDASGKTKIEEIDLKLLAPGQNARFDGTASEEIGFSWSSQKTNPTFTLKIATDPLFKSIHLSRNTSGRSLKLPLPPGGTYYWRLESVTANGKYEQ